MTDRDARVEAALDAYWQVRDRGQDNVASMRAALAAADAVQGGRTVYDCAHNNARYAQPCDRCPAQLADDRRMVDLDKVLEALRTAHDQTAPGFRHRTIGEIADFLEREFGGEGAS